MKCIRYYLLAGILLSFCNTLVGCSSFADSCQLAKKECEKFDEFFERFCYEEDFQLSRIKFPLETIRIDDDTYEYDTVYIGKDE